MLYTIFNSSKTERVIIDEAMSFVVKFLTLPDNVDVQISVAREYDTSGVIFCDFDGDFIFEMEIVKGLPVDELALTIYHEMKHVEQVTTGRLDDLTFERVDHCDKSYMERPWEVEAYSFEKFVAEMRKTVAL